jgi:hypothetical protein
MLISKTCRGRDEFAPFRREAEAIRRQPHLRRTAAIMRRRSAVSAALMAARGGGLYIIGIIDDFGPIGSPRRPGLGIHRRAIGLGLCYESVDDALVAQLEEQRISTPQVAGSSPAERAIPHPPPRCSRAPVIAAKSD